MNSIKGKTKFLSSKIRLLKDFGISVSPEIISRIESLYPNEILVENYTRKLIISKLEGRNFEKIS